MENGRRKFLKDLALGTGVLLTSNSLMGATSFSGNNNISLALIGAGTMGSGDTNTALSVGGVKLISVCDLYDARLEKAKTTWGNHILTTKDYKEILNNPDINTVIIGTPDHWHQQISIEALKAGKNVYCEKPVIRKLEEGEGLINAEQSDKKLVFQTGSQGMSSSGNVIARHIVSSGILGKINFIDGQYSSAPKNLASYKIPEDASEKTIWWKRFLGKAPDIDFDAQRFFYWRNWKEYSTGLAGDLFVHVISSVHYIMDTAGPTKVYSTGGMRNQAGAIYQNIPDVMLAYVDYPDKAGLGEFTLSLGANYVDGVSKKWGSFDIRINGDKGSMRVDWDKVELKMMKKVETFSALDEIKHLIGDIQETSANEYVIKVVSSDKGGHYNHFNNFFNCIKNNAKPIGDARFGVQTAAVALLCNESYEQGGPVFWDPVKMKIVNK